MLRLSVWAVALLLCIGLLTACSGEGDDNTVVATLAPTVISAGEDRRLPSSTGPYADVSHLFDDLCFDGLWALSGQSWTWTSSDDLTTFYDRIDDAGYCPQPITRYNYDFHEHMVVATVVTATGCDLGFTVHPVTRHDAQDPVLPVMLALDPACDYELAEPLAVAIPRMPGLEAPVQVLIISS